MTETPLTALEQKWRDDFPKALLDYPKRLPVYSKVRSRASALYLNAQHSASGEPHYVYAPGIRVPVWGVLAT